MRTHYTFTQRVNATWLLCILYVYILYLIGTEKNTDETEQGFLVSHADTVRVNRETPNELIVFFSKNNLLPASHPPVNSIDTPQTCM